MVTTAVPQPSFTANGFVAPTESAVLAGVLTDFQAAFGGNLNPALNTPQGQLATSETAIIGNTNDLFCSLTQNVDPAFASGRMQDAICRIYFLERNPAESTVVQATCSGKAGVIIPVGALAQAEDGNIYICTQAGTIPISGMVILPFSCSQTGPIACPEGSLDVIYQAIPGWDSVTNASDGAIGNDVESRAAFEARREASVAGNSFGAIGSIIGAVSKVAGILDYYGYDNGTSGNVTVLGQSILKNSIYIAAVGGTDAAVAESIFSKKAPGCGYTGNTSVTVQDNNPLYTAPPSYTVTFERPASLAALFAVNIVNGPTVPSNAVALIQNAIVNAFAGADGGSRARIASLLLASRYYSPVLALGTWVQIRSILIGSNNTASATFTAGITGTVMAVSAVASGTLGAGQTISDVTGNLIEGTTIIAQTSGSAGSTGNYTVSNSQTVSSETMISSIASLNSVQVQANQEPVIASVNIIVTAT